jgi:hypothetical protein
MQSELYEAGESWIPPAEHLAATAPVAHIVQAELQDAGARLSPRLSSLSTSASSVFKRPGKGVKHWGHIQKFCDSIQAIIDKVFRKEHTAQLRHGARVEQTVVTNMGVESEIDHDDDEDALPQRAQQYPID